MLIIKRNYLREQHLSRSTGVPVGTLEVIGLEDKAPWGPGPLKR